MREEKISYEKFTFEQLAARCVAMLIDEPEWRDGVIFRTVHGESVISKTA